MNEIAALCIWREARGEPYEGKLGVAYTMLNRVAKQSWFGKTLLEVVTKPWQYSSMTDPRDPQLSRYPGSSDPAWQECIRALQAAQSGAPDPTNGAVNYFDATLDNDPPKWATDGSLVPAVSIGRLRFYKPA